MAVQTRTAKPAPAPPPWGSTERCDGPDDDPCHSSAEAGQRFSDEKTFTVASPKAKRDQMSGNSARIVSIGAP
jgi:hypothetical protein